MNKTVTINISGIIFHIEEDAYDNLSRYLSTIKGYFSTTDGGNEIMSDIEARIAELLQARINPGKQVILMSDVDQVMNIMGKPEDFGAEPSAGNQKQDQEEAAYEQEKVKRRLFRDPEQRVIGGVCSGLAAYFDIDAVWVRLAMFLLIFFGGISLWVYLVLWIIIPRAKTTAEKFAMRGESANINNILKSFKEEAEDVKNRFRDQRYAENVRSNASRVIGGTFNILGRLVGFFLFLVGGVLLFGYAMSLFGISFADSDTDFAKWKQVIFESSYGYALGLFAYIIVCGIPIFMLVYGGIKLMFRIVYSNRWLNLGLGILWAIGLVIGFCITIGAVKEFSESTRIKETVQLHHVGDTLVVKMSPVPADLRYSGTDRDEDRRFYSNDWYYLDGPGKTKSIIDFVELNIVENTTSDSIEMVISRTARGGSKKEANMRAKEIAYTYNLEGRNLLLDQVFQVATDGKYRAQELDIKIRLPKGKVIYIDKSLKHALDDVENTTNTWDGDMINRRWKMSEKGLTCIDCDNLESVSGRRHHGYDEDEIGNKDIMINNEGIHVSGKDAEINIDDNGIRIKTPDKDYEIKDSRKSKGNKGSKGEKGDKGEK